MWVDEPNRDMSEEPRTDVDTDLRPLLNAVTALNLLGDAMIESDWLDLCQRWQDGLRASSSDAQLAVLFGIFAVSEVLAAEHRRR